MYFNKIACNVQSKFLSYAFSIKQDLLNQVINNKSNSSYFDIKYDELLYKYLYTINTLNYNTTCNKFIHEVYELAPVLDTI